MFLPCVLLAVCLLCFLNGNVLGYEYEVDYSVSYYNEISEDKGMGTTPSPCQSKDLSRWDKLFIMLEDSHMRQNMLLQNVDDMVKQDIHSLRNEIQQLSSSGNKACIKALENTCKGISEQVNFRLDEAMDQFKEAADRQKTQNNMTLQQLLEFSKNQAAQLTKLENSYLQGAGLGPAAMKAFPTNPKEQEAISSDTSKLERILMATASDLQKVQAQLNLFQRSAALRYLPSGCEMALLFPMRSRHTFAAVTPSMSLALRSLTICLWAKLTQSLDRTVLFSYGTRKNPQEFQILVAKRSVFLTVGGESHLVEAHDIVTDGRWGHYCGVWSSEQGLASLWVNGEKVAGSPGVAEGHTLPDGGTTLLGQERSRTGFNRDFDPSVAFTGKMTAVNMWDHVLDADRIRQYAKHDGSCDVRGNVIGWGVSEIIPHGGAQYIN
ncbi:pentraxin-related protein PTX3 [Chanos chanos]|uniref:Pentraxin-related protein PTX3 n=1 Tax=Chanos chanos TaxID=29144 RepID=A0A6J2VC64_CHACN|nr:pentraxin-related protein PTX3 [Chanos chanos]